MVFAGTAIIVGALDLNATLLSFDYTPHSYKDRELVAKAMRGIDNRREIMPLMEERDP